MTPASEKPIIFLSHIHEDYALAQLISTTLTNSFLTAIDCFVASDRTSIKGGDRWLDKIETSIKDALIVLVLCSKDSISRPWVNFEAGAAWLADKRVIPLCHSGFKPDELPQPLSSLQSYDLSKKEDLKNLFGIVANSIRLSVPEINFDLILSQIVQAEKSVQTGFTPEKGAPNLESVLDKKQSTLTNHSNLTRNIICYNQGEYVQYQFIASELHKRLRVLHDSHSDNQTLLADGCKALESFLERNLTRIVHGNFNFLLNHFDGRHDVQPRICVKLHKTRGDRQSIVTIFRDTPVNYESEFELEHNSVFYYISKEGRYCRINNIPQQVADGLYRNARINREEVEKYLKGKTKKREEFGGVDVFDDRWTDCWDLNEKKIQLVKPDPKSCYKSTLVIPMTLWYNDLSEEFTRELDKKRKKTTDISETVGRLIFGNLCFDHVKEEYFSEDTDVDMGYMIADILSLYMIVRSMYTDISHTFCDVKRQLSTA